MNKITYVIASLVFLLSVILTGCLITDDVQAKSAITGILSPSEKLEIEKALSNLLNGKPVSIASDAFMSGNRLIIERAPKLDKLGNPIQGRVLEAPSIFLLKIKNENCFIEHLKSGNTRRLPTVKCKAL